MKLTRKHLAAAMRKTAARADHMFGEKTARELAEAGDEALIYLGHDAARRQRRRVMKRSLGKAVQAAVVVGTGAAALVAARHATRGQR